MNLQSSIVPSRVGRCDQVLNEERSIEERAKEYQQVIAALDPIPGINPIAGITLIAESGVQMSVYRNDGHLTALAGLAPGNAISSDRRRRISVRKGNVYLKRICIQIAGVAIRSKGTFISARFRRLSRRIGRNKATMPILVFVAAAAAGGRRRKRRTSGNAHDVTRV